MASSHGNMEITGLQPGVDRNVITLPTRSEPQASSGKYDGTDILSPLESARVRILDHIKELRNDSVVNLFIAMSIAAIGFLILFSAILQIEQLMEEKNHVFDWNSFVTFALAPKLSVTVFVHLFSIFFLTMYRANRNDIKYFQNEITLVDSLATAVIVAQRPGSAPNMRLVLTALSKNERNRVMKRGEKPITASDEADFLRALPLAARLASRAVKD